MTELDRFTPPGGAPISLVGDCACEHPLVHAILGWLQCKGLERLTERDLFADIRNHVLGQRELAAQRVREWRQLIEMRCLPELEPMPPIEIADQDILHALYALFTRHYVSGPWIMPDVLAAICLCPRHDFGVLYSLSDPAANRNADTRRWLARRLIDVARGKDAPDAAMCGRMVVSLLQYQRFAAALAPQHSLLIERIDRLRTWSEEE